MKQDFSPKKEGIDFGLDSIVVRKFINGILGGVMLDYTNFKENVILAGHCVITDGNGNYKPMPVNGEVYGAMPEGFHYAGVVYRSAKVSEPVSVMFRGVVNKYKLPYPMAKDFDVFGIILGCDVEEPDPYAGYSPIADITSLPTGDAARAASVSVGQVVNEMTADQYYKNVLVSDAEVDHTIALKALDKVILDNVTIAGGKDGANGKITFAASELQLKNISAQENATLYNAFEGYQRTNDPDYTGIKRVEADNLNIDCPSLTHNVINVYTPADDAKIIVKNSKFNLTVDNTNPLRLANYLNAENVTVTFENVEWNYENGLTHNDWGWAGLVIFQPASSDVALHGDFSKIATWKFVFKNCKYNGVKVTANNFGEHNQVFYMYNLNNSNRVADPQVAVEGITLVFE